MRNIPQASVLPAEPPATKRTLGGTVLPKHVQHAGPPWPRVNWWPIIVNSAIVGALLVWRAHWTNTSGHLSLPWDLVLGWIPLIFAWLLVHVVDRPSAHPRWRRFGIIALAASWLLFFPN